MKLPLDSLSPLAAILCGITGGIIVIIENRRIRIGLLLFQYLLVSILMNMGFTPQVVIKLITGLTVSIILFVTARQVGGKRGASGKVDIPTGMAFRMISVLLVSTAAVGVGRSELFVIPDIAPGSLSAALLLGGMGLLLVSLFEDPLSIALGIYSLLNGFGIVYIALESSIAVMALISIVHISIAVVITIIELDVKEDTVRVGDV